MLLPAVPANEAERLARLRALRILDTLPERAFDHIASLARTVCDTPIALISFIDEDRQWFKARIGVDETETPRDSAMCAHAILTPERVTLVEDLSRDLRFADSPLAQLLGDGGFYAGAPIVTADGLALGTVCVIDARPRQLDDCQLDALQRLADLVSHLLEHEGARHQQLERKTVEQQRFMHLLSHDLREPVNGINNFASLLIEEHGRSLPGAALRYLGFVREGGARIGHLIDSLATYAQLDEHVPQLAAVDTEQAIEQLRRHFDAELAQCAGRIEFAPLPPLTADPQLLVLALRHLIGNALKFARPGVAPVVRVSASCEGSHHRLHVADNGVGIAHEHQGNIFGLFTRLHNRRAYDGAGLGLSICQRVADLHGGHLSVESQPEQGSRFTLHLPAVAATA